ncbi:ABC transporter permease [Gorillibacterium sp. CAU 1737]|uniref:ABC transporter permease n=1 Tax=Gorillibacterium sp. CAU 1737 TaxID=3140362 RepID=UPI003260DA51
MGYHAIRKVAWSNIRKRKSASVTLMALILLSIMLLYIGLSVMIKLGSFQEQKMEELQVPDLVSYYSQNDDSATYRGIVKEYPATAKWEAESAMLVGETRMKYGNAEVLAGLLLLKDSTPRTLSPHLKAPGQPEAAGDELVYLPYMFELSGGYKVGDAFTFAAKGHTFSFIVGGFYEEALLGSFTNSAVKLFVSDSAFAKLEEGLGEEARYELLSISLNDAKNTMGKISQQLAEKLTSSKTSGSYVVMEAATAIEGNQFLIKLLAAILVVFSLLIVGIALFVMRFQIQVQLEDSMVNIGVLKANGYTSGQIKGAILLQFGLIGLAAALPGLVLSGILMPYVGNMISASLGLLWPTAFDSLSALLSLVTILGLLLLVVVQSSRRIRSITPITALQSGLQTHNFKRNPVPLAASRLPLQLALGLKALVRQIKQNVMLFLIVAGLMFSSVFCLILNYNMTRDNTGIINLVGIERSSLMIAPQKGFVTPEMLAELSQVDGVQKLTQLDGMSATIGERVVLLQVSNDYSKLETQTVYKGRHPLYDNEVSLSGIVAKQIGKSIGDEVTIVVNGVSQNYLITGFSQQITQLGMVASMTSEGFHHLMPDYAPKTVNVYLKEGKDPAAVIQELEQRHPGEWTSRNMEEWLEGILGTFTSAITAITWTITAVTLFVVSLILYLVIKTLVVRRKKEFGVLKGMGYRSLQIMTQISLSLLPVILLGVVVGGVLGSLFSDDLFVLLLGSLGIYNVDYTVDVSQVLLLAVSLVAISYAVTMLVSRRVRKISVTSLISE